MSEEEKQVIDILESFEPDDLIQCAIYRNALEKINNLLEKQQTKINKALKFIADNRYIDDNGCGYEFECMTDIDELVSILKGE